MPSEWQEQRVNCQGGLETNQNHLLMSQGDPGIATNLVNYEVAPSGGYARLLGYEEFNDDHPEVGVGSTEGSILGIMHYENTSGTDTYYAARKNTSGSTYSIWLYNAGSAWTNVTLPATRNTTDSGRNITRLRSVLYNDGSNNYLVIVDGVNEPLIYDGTTWREMTNGNTGTTSSPGGNQMIDYPTYVATFNRHLFFARDDGAGRAIVCHSAPDAPYNFTSASGGGQILPGFDVTQIYPFREQLYVFGENQIGAIQAVDGNFVYKDVVSDVGCVASDTVSEMGSAVVFLSADGFRPIAGTDRIGDVEIAPITERVRPLLISASSTYSADSFNIITVRTKNQLRMSYGGTNTGTTGSDFGFIMGTRKGLDGSFMYESGQTYQLNFWCGLSKFIDGEELVLHGGYDGKVYRQERGNSFNGSAIYSSFAGPYLDQGSVHRRKAYKKIYWFLRLDFSAGSFTDQEFSVGTRFNWDSQDAIIPPDYSLVDSTEAATYGDGSLYGDGTVYGGNDPAVIERDIEGTNFSIKPTFVSTTITPRHVLFGYVVVFNAEGVN